ncbi:MAG: hypothetical protein JW878_00170 [Methanomicrobia archaeon]|nr:hypothetical protein [Methanomicrobia archaeon]
MKCSIARELDPDYDLSAFVAAGLVLPGARAVVVISVLFLVVTDDRMK